MKKALLVLFILSAANSFVSAKMRRFVWEDEICTYEGWYDAARYSKKQLENTYRLWYSQDFELFARKGERQIDGRWEPFTLEWLDYQYGVKSAVLRGLNVVDTPYWQNVKRRKLLILEQRYRLERATFEAVREPLVLRRTAFAEACLAKYAEPLIAGGDSLLRIWREENESQRKKSAYEDDMRRLFEERMASADRLKYAREEVLRDGWWECVASKIGSSDDEGIMHRNFRKLFKRVRRMGCDYAYRSDLGFRISDLGFINREP